MSVLTVRPITLREANEFVVQHHRHHSKTTGHKFSVSVVNDESLVGVAIAGRPVARCLDDGLTLEILRVCSDGTPNACSMLLGACRRTGKAMGYQKIITYTLNSENGASLRAAGFRLTELVKGRSWDSPTRRRTDRHPTCDKLRWEA